MVLELCAENYSARVEIKQYVGESAWQGEFMWLEKTGTTEYYDEEAKGGFDALYSYIQNISPDDADYARIFDVLELMTHNVNISEGLHAYMLELIEQLPQPASQLQ